MTDSRVDARTFAVSSTGFVHAERSVLTTSLPDSVGLMQLNPSLGPFELDHVTIAHVGAPSGSDAAFELRPETPLDTRLHAVAIEGYTRGFRREPANQNPENVVISDSAWDPSNDELGGQGAGVFVESGNSHVAPDVVNLSGGELHPRRRIVRDRPRRDQRTRPSSPTSTASQHWTATAMESSVPMPERSSSGLRRRRPRAAAGVAPATGSPRPTCTAPVLKKLRARYGGRSSGSPSRRARPRPSGSSRSGSSAAGRRRRASRSSGAWVPGAARWRSQRRSAGLGLLRRGTVRLAVVATRRGREPVPEARPGLRLS